MFFPNAMFRAVWCSFFFYCWYIPFNKIAPTTRKPIQEPNTTEKRKKNAFCVCVCVLLQTSNTPNKWRKMNYVDTNRIWQTTLNYYFINLPSATLLPRCDTTKTRNAPNKWWMDFILFTKLDKFHLDLGFVLCIFVPVFSFFFISIFINV